MANPLQPSLKCVRLTASPTHPIFLKPRRQFSQASLSPSSHQRPSRSITHPSRQARAHFRPVNHLTTTSRHASTSTPTANPTSTREDVLTWDRFFDLRRKRRYLNLGASFLTAGGAVGVFGPILAQQDIDGWAAQISGLDPIIVLGITTFAVAAGGWLSGPTFGNSLFKVWAGRKGWNQPISEVSLREGRLSGWGNDRGANSVNYRKRHHSSRG